MRERLKVINESIFVVLPDELLEEFGFGDEVDIITLDDGLLLKPVARHEEAPGKQPTEDAAPAETEE